MKILIIGSKGFIGSHLISYYLKKNIEVYGCDVIIDYENKNYILIDATNSDFHSVFEKNEFDVCINCSGAASVPDSLVNPFRDYQLNTYNVYKILDAIRIYRPECKFLNLSSAAVYGNPRKLPIREDLELSPLSPYGIHKMQAEVIIEEFYQFYKLKTCSVRIFSAFGEGLKKQLFWDLYKKAIAGNVIQLYGTGNESRDFIYIDDLVFALDLVVRNSNFDADVFNIANGEEVLIKDAVQKFYKNFTNKVEYSFSYEERLGDPNNWVANIDKLKSIGYEPKYSLSQGLFQYYKWIKSLAT